MNSILISGLAAAGVMVAAMAPATVKAEPQALTISEMDVVTAGWRRWGGLHIDNNQSNRAKVVQKVSASASCASNCSLTVSASAVAVVEQNNNFDVD
jgi:hypothetical protein